MRSGLLRLSSSHDDAIVAKDLDGVITTWNRGAERLFGYTAEETIGKPITILIPHDRQDEEYEILDRIVAESTLIIMTLSVGVRMGVWWTLL